jgi:hypothetical protein
MEAAMRHRLDLAEAMLCERAHLSNIDGTTRHGDKEILPNICGLDFDAYAARGIHLERTQTLAGGARHCNFRFSQLSSDQDHAHADAGTSGAKMRFVLSPGHHEFAERR